MKKLYVKDGICGVRRTKNTERNISAVIADYANTLGKVQGVQG